MKVSPKIIQALTLFVPKEDLRQNIMRINFELQLDKTILTATNGRVLLTVCINKPNEKEDAFNIPPGLFLKSDIDYEISRGEDGKVYVINGLVKVEAPQTEWKYPDFRRVIPSKPAEKIEHKCYDPEYLMLFKKAAKLLGGAQFPIIHPNDIVDIGLNNAIGVISPLNPSKIRPAGYQAVDASPSWLHT